MEKTIHRQKESPTLLQRFTALLFNLIIPGAGLALVGHWRPAYLVQFSLIAAVSVICWSRLVFEPWGVLLLLGLVMLVYLVSTGFCIVISSSLVMKPLVKTASVGLFLFFSTATLSAGFIYKSYWLGVQVYFVPSPSMQPTLEPGDIILVDTWAYQERSPQQKDVAIFHHKSNNQWLVKRIGTWPNGKLTNNGEYFMLGDNAKASQDSRFFGGVGSEQLAGKVKLVLLAIDHKHKFQFGRYLQQVN